MRAIAFLFLASALLVRAETNPTGRWEGTAQIPGREMRLIIDLAPEGDKNWRGSVIIPDLNIAGAALADITRNGAELSFSIKGALADPKSQSAKFKARLESEDKIAGEFVQAGNRAPFSLTKVGPPQILPPPRSTVIAKELEGEWQGSYELFGYPRKVTIKLKNRGADGASADFLIVGKKENHLPVDLVTQEGDFITIDSHETGLSFEGRIEKGEIKGLVLQGPLEIPVTMTRAN